MGRVTLVTLLLFIGLIAVTVVSLGLGYADKATLHAAAQAVLGRPYGLGNPPAPSKPTTCPPAPAAA